MAYQQLPPPAGFKDVPPGYQAPHMSNEAPHMSNEAPPMDYQAPPAYYQPAPQYYSPPQQQQNTVLLVNNQPVSNTTYIVDDESPNHLLHCCISIFCPWWLFVWICICCIHGC